jgi:hypothetical protein
MKLLSILLALSLVFSAGAFAKTLDWNVTATDTGAAVADCNNCDENISLLISCERGKREREVHFFLLEQRDDKLAGKSAIVSVTGDDKTKLSVSAIYSQPGEAGPYPVAKLAASDPLFALLSKAKAAQFVANGEVITFDLTGTRRAFDKMDKHCK